MPNIQENITRIQGAKSSLKTSIENKGVTIPDDALIDTYYTYVDQIQTGSSSGGSSDYDSTMEDKHFTINNDNGWPRYMSSATISDGVTSIPDNAFLNSGLIEIEIPNSVTSLGNSCFSACRSLSSIDIPDSVTSIGDDCFSGCTVLTSVDIPSGVTELPDYCFSYCRSLSSVTIPDSVTSLGSYCFYHCYSLSSVTIPDSVTSIGGYCFNTCSGLTSINIPDSVTSIGDDCFSNCRSLSSVTISDSVTNIGSQCFSSCSGLTSIDIPDLVTRLGYNCFVNCSGLTAITCLPTTPPTSGWGMFDNTNNSPIYVPNDSVGTYKSAWSDYAGRIFPIDPEPLPTGSTENADIDVVYDVTSSTNPTQLFWSGQSIDYFTIDDNNTAYEPTNFYDHTFDTTGYHTVHYYLTGDTIGESIFANCDRIETATVGSGVTTLGNNLFYKCTGLTSAIIPNNAINWGTNVFSGCTSLSSVTLPSNLIILNYETFCGCSSLSSVTIPNSVTRIGDNCFSGCTALTSIDLPDNIEYMGGNIFEDCSGLTSVEIPTGITGVPQYYVNGCSSLSSVTIPENITNIGSNAFRDCSSLQWIECLPTTPPNMITSLEMDNTNNCPIYVPDASVDTYKSAAIWGTSYGDRIFPISDKASLVLTYNSDNNTFPICSDTGISCIDYYKVDDDPTHYDINTASTQNLQQSYLARTHTFDSTGEHTIYFYLKGDRIEGLLFCIIGGECLETVKIKSSVREIGGDNFSNGSLDYAIIGENVVKIEENCFNPIIGGYSIECLPTTPPTLMDEYGNALAGCNTIYVPDASVEAYKSASGWSKYASIIQPLSSKPE